MKSEFKVLNNPLDYAINKRTFYLLNNPLDYAINKRTFYLLKGGFWKSG